VGGGKGWIKEKVRGLFHGEQLEKRGNGGIDGEKTGAQKRGCDRTSINLGIENNNWVGKKAEVR